MTDTAELSLDNGTKWRPIDLVVTGGITNGIDLLGVLFTSDDESLPPLVDSPQQIVLLVPGTSDDPLVGVLRRQGIDYWLHLNTN